MITISQSNIPLIGSEAYRSTIRRRPNPVEETRIVEAARAGSDLARAQLLEICRARAWLRAISLAAFYWALRGVVLDPQDIAQEAMLRAWRRMNKALTAPNPLGYLMRSLEGAMLTFCRERQNAIRVPACQQSRGKLPADVVSLDAPLSGYDQVTLADLLPAT